MCNVEGSLLCLKKKWEIIAAFNGIQQILLSEGYCLRWANSLLTSSLFFKVSIKYSSIFSGVNPTILTREVAICCSLAVAFGYEVIKTVLKGTPKLSGSSRSL